MRHGVILSPNGNLIHAPILQPEKNRIKEETFYMHLHNVDILPPKHAQTYYLNNHHHVNSLDALMCCLLIIL